MRPSTPCAGGSLRVRMSPPTSRPNVLPVCSKIRSDSTSPSASSTASCAPKICGWRVVTSSSCRAASRSFSPGTCGSPSSSAAVSPRSSRGRSSRSLAACCATWSGTSFSMRPPHTSTRASRSCGAPASGSTSISSGKLCSETTRPTVASPEPAIYSRATTSTTCRSRCRRSRVSCRCGLSMRRSSASPRDSCRCTSWRRTAPPRSSSTLTWRSSAISTSPWRSSPGCSTTRG